ncbi:hypothetical protein [Enterococcus wangshanyuanii]|uniref:HEPN AbiU2-like domain-containing protein n=1 Tax=Enterococcus wangshanyuanii TaxID=2005703 RepID=A0ABQ1PSW2_9ENTE|nr:hypothetical protein [Enterococcus wangshanyuanii]GGD02791.1 hypothetical protein GCM10011573_35350 [Enterococcus wangshanyuanii]
MNQKNQLEKLERSIKWIFKQILGTKKTYAAILAVSEVTKKNNALSEYGDYFAYTQNVMVGDVLLQLSKFFVDNKDSHSVPKIIRISNDLFTEDYYKKTGYNQHTTYEKLKSELVQMEEELDSLEKPISHLKKIRNRDLAHLDKRISNEESRENLIQSNPIYLSDVLYLFDFAFKSLSTIRGTLFNISFNFQEPSYIYELEKIAELIEKEKSIKKDQKEVI